MCEITQDTPPFVWTHPLFKWVELLEHVTEGVSCSPGVAFCLIVLNIKQLRMTSLGYTAAC